MARPHKNYWELQPPVKKPKKPSIHPNYSDLLPANSDFQGLALVRRPTMTPMYPGSVALPQFPGSAVEGLPHEPGGQPKKPSTDPNYSDLLPATSDFQGLALDRRPTMTPMYPGSVALPQFPGSAVEGLPHSGCSEPSCSKPSCSEPSCSEPSCSEEGAPQCECECSEPRDSEKSDLGKRKQKRKPSKKFYPKPKPSPSKEPEEFYPKPKPSKKFYPKPKPSPSKEPEEFYPKPKPSKTPDPEKFYPKPKPSPSKEPDATPASAEEKFFMSYISEGLERNELPQHKVERSFTEQEMGYSTECLDAVSTQVGSSCMTSWLTEDWIAEAPVQRILMESAKGKN